MVGKKSPPPPPHTHTHKSQQTNKNTSQWRNQLKKMSTPLFEAHSVCTDCSAKLSTVKVKQNKTKTVNYWIKCILSVQTSCQNQGYHRYHQRENDHLASIYQFMCDTNLHISYAITEPVHHHYLFNVYQSSNQSFFDKKAAQNSKNKSENLSVNVLLVTLLWLSGTCCWPTWELLPPSQLSKLT